MPRGERVVLRSTVPAGADLLDRTVREPEVALRRPPPEDHARVLAVLVEGEAAGAIRFGEETAPEFRHAAPTSSRRSGDTGRARAPAPCAPWPGGWWTSAATTGR
ncbi:hypothetical protein Sgou_17220 [Streptomyces gougerotii]|uniref:Uncharacterized protein n=3 Tax=Streptomyces TaxID=1883 RepID=A0A8H9HHY3_9ACTN|nr:hypothetical protein [Streptomyces sp. DSM 41037]SUO94808.1 Kanamycin acetyltransferase [Streptomyces griseus]GFH74744.1 hypothetical protein Sdia_55120 [Streptomyces diastaticus subsp. diastaticus]GFH77052.1 hypothetical protein Sgou_17220 [Streptomyces gougerotii]GGU05052.1 hypothetical protein GCM10015534_03810 [Streptomyces diastaticus subsp. diastaticus]